MDWRGELRGIYATPTSVVAPPQPMRMAENVSAEITNLVRRVQLSFGAESNVKAILPH